jgi:hypothetical protein
MLQTAPPAPKNSALPSPAPRACRAGCGLMATLTVTLQQPGGEASALLRCPLPSSKRGASATHALFSLCEAHLAAPAAHLTASIPHVTRLRDTHAVGAAVPVLRTTVQRKRKHKHGSGGSFTKMKLHKPLELVAVARKAGEPEGGCVRMRACALPACLPACAPAPSLPLGPS